MYHTDPVKRQCKELVGPNTNSKDSGAGLPGSDPFSTTNWGSWEVT